MQIFVNNRLEAIDYMVKFLVRKVGWTIAEIVTNTGSSKDFTLVSVGEKSVENPNNIYIRLQSQATSIKLFTYETYTNSSTNTGAVSEATNGLVTLSTSSIFTVVADLERVFFHISEGGGTTRYFGYAGRIDSYYDWPAHQYPHAIKGMTAAARDFFSASSSIYLRRPDGTVVAYNTLRAVNEDCIQASSISARTRRPSAFSYPLSYTAVGGQEELVGALRGIYHVPEETIGPGDFINIGGRMYWCFKGDGVWAWAAGPVSEDNKVPPLIPRGLDLVIPL
jgi:hypothetical protein